MAFCGSCGTQVADGTTFCPSCGKPVAAAAAGGTATAAAPAPSAPAAASSGLADNVAGLLCYSPVGLICDIIWLVAEPYKSNKFLRFHAFQSLFMAGAWIVLWIGLMIVGAVLTAVGGALGLIMFPIDMVVSLGFLVLCVIMMVKAYQMQTPHLPIIGALADKQV